MGMLLGDKGGLSDENAVIVSDILGQEDALGTMDCKCAVFDVTCSSDDINFTHRFSYS